MSIRLVTLKRGLLVFWATCFVRLLDECAGRTEASGPAARRLALQSGNFPLVLSVVQVYRMPALLAAMLFAGVILWEGRAWLFWRAALRFRGDDPATLAITAFAFSIALWAAFCVTLEALIAFDKIGEGTFQALFSANLSPCRALPFARRLRFCFPVEPVQPTPDGQVQRATGLAQTTSQTTHSA